MCIFAHDSSRDDAPGAFLPIFSVVLRSILVMGHLGMLLPYMLEWVPRDMCADNSLSIIMRYMHSPIVVIL
jgi:hypothetical protein